MMRRSLILLLVLGGCASPGEGRWPSLATRPGEVQPLVQRPTVTAAAGPAAQAPRSAATSDAAARLSSLERDTAALATRIAAQRTASGAASRGTGASDEASATAEVEATRAARLVSQAGDLRDRLDALAGDLARRAAAGEDVAALLTRLGAAIDRVEELRARR